MGEKMGCRKMKSNNFKKVILVGGVMGLVAVNTLAGNIPKINLNDNKILMLQSPFIENGRTYVPLRAVSENLGAVVKWEAETKTITINNGKTTVICQIGNNQATVNSKQVPLEALPKHKFGSTCVPLRFTSDCLGAEVNYDKNSNTIDITYEVPEKAGVKYVDGRAIRTTALPKNAKDFPYILEGIPNEMYELKAEYEYLSTAKEGKDYIRPCNVKTDPFYSEENVKLWKKIVESNLDHKFNVDYTTIDNNWAVEMAKTYIEAQSEEKVHYNKYLNYAKDYISYVKRNKIKIEGDYYVEPSICYLESGAMYLRCWVSFKCTSSATGNFKLFEKHESVLKAGTTYAGYVDIGLGTSTYGADGKDLGIGRDTISETAGIKEMKK